MRKLFIASALSIALALASCTTTDIDEGIRKSLPQVCGAAETSYLIVKPYIDAGKLKPATAAGVEAAHANLQVYCASKDTATLASTLILASQAALTISIAVREAKRAE